MKQDRRPAGGRERGLTRRQIGARQRLRTPVAWWWRRLEITVFKDGEFVASRRFILRDEAIRMG
jgi:hypothetical protein